EDVPLLADQFRQRFARKHGIEVSGISKACLAELTAHDWPGNVRELQNVIERAVILCSEGGALEPAHLGLASSSGSATQRGDVIPLVGDNGEFLTLTEIEKRHILAALSQAQGNRTHAAKMLDISIRTLRNKLNDYNKKEKAPAREKTAR